MNLAYCVELSCHRVTWTLLNAWSDEVLFLNVFVALFDEVMFET